MEKYRREVDNIVDLIDNDELSYSEFIDIENSVKGHLHFDDDDYEVTFGDVKEYLYESIYKEDEINEVCSILGVPYDILDVDVKTLADRMRLNMLLELYNKTSSIEELEKLINKLD